MTSMPYSDAFHGDAHPAPRAERMRHAHVLDTLIDEALASGRMVRLRADGASMHPAIRDGEAIAIESVAPEEVEPGNVLLCRHDARLLAHRVVGVTMHGAVRMFELRGDAKGANDAPVPADAVVGRVVGVWRNGRIVSVGARAARGDSVYHRTIMRLARAARTLVERARLR
jgi:signal peptidase I